MAVGADGVARGLADRAGQGAVFDRSAIDEKVLEPAACERDGAAGHEPRQPQGSGARLELLEVTQCLAAEDLEDARRAIHGGGRVEGLAAVGPQGKRHGGIGHGGARDGRGGGPRLRFRLSQELPPGRSVREESLDEHVGSARPAGRLLGGRRPVLDPKPDRLGGGPVARREREPGDGSDRGERLAAETVAANLRKVLVGGDLGRRVTLERKPRVLRRHPAAVVPDEDALDASVLEIHLDAGRPGVQGVLDQLLDDGGRTLHHLARGDPVDHVARKPVDLRHLRWLVLDPWSLV